MEEMRTSAAQMQRPIKTEWNSQCVLFTYFQGDISSVVDEHFSRALNNVKKPQELSPLSQNGDVVPRNDIDMPPNQWRFSSQWTKPQPEVFFANGVTNCIMNGFDPMAMNQYPLPLTRSPSVQPGNKYFPPDRELASVSLVNASTVSGKSHLEREEKICSFTELGFEEENFFYQTCS